MLANFVAWCIPPARRAFEKEAMGIRGASFKEATRFMLKASFFMALVVIPLSLIGTFNYAYVTENGIVLRPLLSIKEKPYEWSDISTIYTESSSVGRTLDLKYVLHMKDGTQIDLLNETRLHFLKVYKQIKSHLDAQINIVIANKESMLFLVEIA